MSQYLQEAPVIGNIDSFKPSKSAERAFKMVQRLGKKNIENMSVPSIQKKLLQFLDGAEESEKGAAADSIMDLASELAEFIRNRGAQVKKESTQFPKLQALTEAKKSKKVEDEMDFAGGEVEPKGKADTVDKAAVLSFLKSCDAKCRADVKKKLDKMVAADEAAAE